MPPYRQRQRQPAERSVAARGIIGVVVVLVLVAIAATAWVLGTNHKASPPAAGGPTASASGTSSAASSVVLTPTGDGSYNAYSPGSPEDSQDVGNAIDGKPSTGWNTQWYGTAKFGGLKPGTGLIIDMGKAVKLSQVEVRFGPNPGTSASIYIGNTNTVSQAAFSTFTKVASASNISGDYKFPVSSAATGQYVIVWLTNLPLALPSSGAPPSFPYQGLIYEVTVRGTPAAG